MLGDIEQVALLGAYPRPKFPRHNYVRIRQLSYKRSVLDID